MISQKTARLINSLKDKEQIRILFVCLGNICRSPAAEGMMRSIVEEADAEHRWVIDSAGTGSWHIGQLPDKRMRVHAARRGLNLTHHARQVHQSDFDDFDIIVAMDDNNASDLRRLAPSLDAADKIVRMIDFATLATRYDCIPDPYYEGSEGFELVLDLLDDACHHLAASLSPR